MSEPAAATAVQPENRLHPMSWLFVLLQQLRQFIVPLLALVVFGQGDRHELWPLIGVGVLAAMSVWQYFTYRYAVTGDALVVRSGLLERSVRVIPFARIHNVGVQQSLLHRFFGVAEVRLESAGGKKPEAEMRVLALDAALALERLVRHRGAAAAVDGTSVDGMPGATAAEGTPLLALDTGEVLRLGLVSNRGMILLAAAFGGMWQVPGLGEQLFEGWGEAAFGWAEHRQFGAGEYALAGLTLVLLAMAALRLLSMLLSVLQYHGFELREHGKRLTVERGLLNRWRTSASRRRIQAWTLEEGVLHRLLRRRSLAVDTAVGEDPQQQQRALRELAPIATPAQCDALVEHLLPAARWSALDWTPQPARNAWRLWWPDVVFTSIAAAAVAWRFGAWGLVVLAWLPWAGFVAWQHARRLAWAAGDEIVAVRGGWWKRHWRFAEIDKVQALSLTRNAIDRWCGTATVKFDTAGAGGFAPALRIRFLPVEEARGVYERLGAVLAKRPLRW